MRPIRRSRPRLEPLEPRLPLDGGTPWVPPPVVGAVTGGGPIAVLPPGSLNPTVDPTEPVDVPAPR